MKKHSRPLMTIGISSLILIFVSLCLFTFAVLSLVSARADYRLSTKIADRTTAYYEASGQATEILAEIDDLLWSRYPDFPKDDTFFADLPGLSYDSGEQTLAFQVPVGENQCLSVVLSLHRPVKESDVFYTIREWKTISLADWNADTRQNVYIKPTP